MTNTKLSKNVAFAGALLLSIVTLNTQASECKGLANQACSASNACGWVEGYTRKDGREVNAYCRTSTKGKEKPSKAVDNPK